MEIEYISREAAIYVHKLQCAGCANQQAQDYSEHCKVCTIYNEIKCTEALPAADVRPVVRGEWIDNGRYKAPTCSNCGSGCLLNYESDYHESDFCPHCGADMRIFL